MINLFKKKNQRTEEEEKLKQEQEAQAQDGQPTAVVRVKKSPGELRLKKEIGELDLPRHAEIHFPDQNNIMKFELFVNLADEQSSLWSGGKYKFTVNVSNGYPHEAPKCHCETPIYHPNIDLQGNVCLNILRADWKPVLGINTVILGLVFLFIEPNPNDPLNKEAAELMRNNPASFAQKVKTSLRGGNIDGVAFPKLI